MENFYKPIAFGYQIRPALFATCTFALFFTLSTYLLNDAASKNLFIFTTIITACLTILGLIAFYKSLKQKTYIVFDSEGFTIPPFLFEKSRRIKYAEVIGLYVGQYGLIKYCKITTKSDYFELSEFGFENNFMLLKFIHNLATELPQKVSNQDGSR